MVIEQNASIAGAAGGCQAECGSAAGMAAGALVELAGGTPRQVGEAVALAIKNLLGLVCDPVAGLVEVPCVKRNGFAAVHSMKVSIIGATGYAGAELLRLLNNHPEAQVVHITSERHTGEPISSIYPHLRGIYDQILM